MNIICLRYVQTYNDYGDDDDDDDDIKRPNYVIQLDNKLYRQVLAM